MTRKTSWANPDGLIVGFGPNYVDRIQSAVTTQKDGDRKVAKLHITFQSVFGNTPNQAAGSAFLPIPAGTTVENVYMKITTNWAGGTSLAFGDATTPGGWITAAQGAEANLVTTNSPIQSAGAYAIATGTSATAPKPYPTATNLFVTSVGTHTAGEADIYVEYS